MSANDKIMAVVKEWAAKAENDLKSAAHLLTMKGCPADTFCFHGQQCVEKYLKALLVVQELEFPKTHDLGELIALLPSRLRPSLDDEEQDNRTPNKLDIKVFDVLAIACAQVVKHTDIGNAIEVLDDVASNEARAAGYKNSHSDSPTD